MLVLLVAVFQATYMSLDHALRVGPPAASPTKVPGKSRAADVSAAPRFTAFSCTIDMSVLEGCHVQEIRVERTDDFRYWCRARCDPHSAPIDLGPAVLGPDGSLSERWGGARALVGGPPQIKSFLDALRGFLIQRGIVSGVA